MKRLMQLLLTAAFALTAATVHAQAPVPVASKRVVTGAPPLFAPQPDRELPGRFVGFTANGCALSFAASAVRGLTWTGACVEGRMQGQGTVMGYNEEQQPIFTYEGNIVRGLRSSGVIYGFERKNGEFVGTRTPIVGSALQPETEMRFLDLPRPFLLALDDWQRQISGENFLASLGATWAPVVPSAKAGGTGGGAAASAAAACSRTYDACSTGCALGGVISALGGGRADVSAANRCIADCGNAQQQCLGGGAPAATSNSGGSGSSQAGRSSMPTGRAALIALTPPGNARSRNECVKVEMLDAPIAQAKANDPTLVDSYSFGTSRDGRRLGQKHYVAYNTCNERLIVFAVSCSQIHMTNAGSNYGDNWVRGEFAGIRTTGPGVKNVRNDVRLWVSNDYVSTQPSYKNNMVDQAHITVAVYYGAWPEEDIQTTSGFTKNAESFSRKRAAVNRLANKVINSTNPDSSQLEVGGSSAMFPNSSWRKIGVQTCDAFKANEVWSSTP